MIVKLKNVIKKCKPLSKMYYSCRKLYNLKKKRKNQKKLKKFGNELAKTLFEALANKPITYFFTFGSLLGLVREGHFISYDDDMDVGIINSGVNTLQILESCLLPKGFKKLHSFSVNGQIQEVAFSWKGLKVDFFLYTIIDSCTMITYEFVRRQGGNYAKNEFSVAKISATPIKSTIIKNINGINYMLPYPEGQYLAETYGETWRTPDPNWVATNNPRWGIMENTIGYYQKY